MRVLHLGDPASVGYTFVKYLRLLNIKADLLVNHPRPSNLLFSSTDPDAIEPLVLKLTDSSNVIRRSLELIHEIEPDIIHAHYATSPLTFAALLSRKPVILHVHGTDMRGSVSPIARGCMRSSLRVLCSTPDLLHIARKHQPESSFFPSPVDFDWFRPTGEPIYQDRVFVHSRASFVKGTDVVMAAAKILPSVRFDMVPWGDALNTYRRMAPSNVFFFETTVPRHELPSTLSMYPLILGQFRLGVLGLSELEAMACGRPVATFLNGRFRKSYGRPPPVLNITNPRSLAETIIGGLDFDRGLGLRSLAWVHEFHDPVKLTRRLIHMYKEALD